MDPRSASLAQEAEAAVHRAAAKVDELDARVRAELDKEKAVAGAIEMSRKKARAAQAASAELKARREEEEEEGEEWTEDDYHRHAKARSTMGSPVYENDQIRAARRARARAEAAAPQEEEDDEEESDSESDAKKPKRAPKKDLLAMYGSHEKVLTHYMQLSNGFVVEDHGASEVQAVQLVVPKCGVEKMKSFRARFGRHLRAIGFVPNTPEEAEKQARLLKPQYLEYAKTFDSNVWLRVYAIDPNRAFAQRRLDPHTLLEEKPLDAIDPVLLEDPLADA